MWLLQGSQPPRRADSRCFYRNLASPRHSTAQHSTGRAVPVGSAILPTPLKGQRRGGVCRKRKWWLYSLFGISQARVDCARAEEGTKLEENRHAKREKESYSLRESNSRPYPCEGYVIASYTKGALDDSLTVT